MKTHSKSIFNIFTLLAFLASLLGSAIFVTPAYAAAFTVTKTADTNDGVCNADCSLREAITAANANGAGSDTLTLPPGIYTLTLGSQLPAVTTTIIINGDTVANTIVQANAVTRTATYRIFEISSSGNLTLNNLTVRNGQCLGLCATSPSFGGGILNQGTLTVTNSAISGNTTNQNGGGIYSSGTLTITKSTISGNTTNQNGGGIFNSGPMTVTKSTFPDNFANQNGGGIHNSGDLSVTNSTFSGNSAVQRGGGINNETGTLTVTNSTFSGNWADINGGGVSRVSGTVTLKNTIIANSPSGHGANCENILPGTFTADSKNLSDDSSCASATISATTNLGALLPNGGSTLTFALLAGSSAIDTGDNSVCPSTDQRDIARPPGTGCDVGSFETDSTYPIVVSDSLVARYTTGPSSFTVTFNKNVYDPIGDTDFRDVTNSNNYLIVESGANGTLNTVSCLGGLAGDDSKAIVTSVTYNAASFTATVNLASPLPNGNYHLFVCGTTSIVDAAFNKLNNGLSDYTFDFVVRATTTSGATTVASIPKTGFTPNKITSLPAQPANFAYSNLGSIWLEIPSQNIQTNIVGIPKSDNTWDVKWLGADAGWLNGTAFPSWEGNSVLTAHVTDSNGLPGPFANLKGLKYDDQVIVHINDEQYIFVVRNTRIARPYSTNLAFEHLEGHSYLTLITCQGYNPLSDSYLFRRIVRAVLMDVK